MLNFLKGLYHALTSSSCGQALTKMKATAEADYAASIKAAETGYKSAITTITETAKSEVEAMLHAAAALKARAAALIETDLDLGTTHNAMATTIHAGLSTAVQPQK